MLTTTSGLSLCIRDPRPSDRRYVAGSMLKTVRPETEDEADDMMALWDGLARLRTILHLSEDPGLIVGFAMGDPSVPRIDYLHVRGGFRRMGVGRLLAEVMGSGHGIPTAVTYRTPDLTRRIAGRDMPIGLLHNEHWRLTWPGGRP